MIGPGECNGVRCRGDLGRKMWHPVRMTDQARHNTPQEPLSASLDELTLPCPPPLTEAVECGLFGGDGVEDLTPELIYALTREQFYELVALRLDIEWLVCCGRSGQDPTSGKRPRSLERQEAIRHAAREAAVRLELGYADCLAAYEQGFGEEVARELDACVRGFVGQQTPQNPEPPQQLLLF